VKKQVLSEKEGTRTTTTRAVTEWQGHTLWQQLPQVPGRTLWPRNLVAAAPPAGLSPKSAADIAIIALHSLRPTSSLYHMV
jgi:hypothetical protein